MPTPDITALTSDLRALGGQRVWSLMISLFGDLAQGEGEQIAGPVLSAMMAAMQIKPEAARVALHRLRNDGWVTSEKSGRISWHGLTVKARCESIAASPRIYALPEAAPSAWQLILLQRSDAGVQAELTASGFSQILPRVYIGDVEHPAPTGALALQGAEAPAWLMEQMVPAALMAEYSRLNDTLRALAAELPASSRLGALDTAVLRCLIVHNWRRLVLKHAAPPQGLIAHAGGMHQCHVIVSQLLARFPRPALTEIAQEQATV